MSRLRIAALCLLLVCQVSGASFFLADLLSSRFALFSEPIPWGLREVLETLAAVALVAGILMGTLLILRMIRDLRQAEVRARRASVAFQDLLDQRFDEWGLTRAERDVALFALKGLSLQEMARLRDASEGTIKSQTNAIYRKSGVSGRPQLLALIIEDMIGDDLRSPVETAQPAAPTPVRTRA